MEKVYWPNGMEVTTDEMIDVLMWFLGEDMAKAINHMNTMDSEFKQRAVNYYAEKH